MKKKSLTVLFIILITVLTLGYLFLRPAFNYVSGYLSKSEQVKANILIVEGWLPSYALKMAYDEANRKVYDYIITTGLKSIPSYYLISDNGYLIFYPKKKFPSISGSGTHFIEVDAYSELEGGNSAHFNLYLNDLVIDDFFCDIRKKKYTTSWKGNLNEIDSILIQFDNDGVGDYGDRNLYVKEITIDHKIKLLIQDNTEYDIGELDGKRRVINNFSSDAVLARNSLLLMDIDSSLIVAVPGERVRINRTLTSALAFRDWLKTAGIDVKGINIISMGTHARRTWMTYNKILNEKYKIGIISIPDSKIGYSRKDRTLRTIRETLGIIYYWFILMPY